jgi:hypothetical protein
MPCVAKGVSTGVWSSIWHSMELSMALNEEWKATIRYFMYCIARTSHLQACKSKLSSVAVPCIVAALS